MEQHTKISELPLHDTASAWQAIPVACQLPGPEQAQRWQDVADNLWSAVQQLRELDDGYAARFPGDAAYAARLLAFIEHERQCCPFFIFTLVFEPAEGPIWLYVQGPEGTKLLVKEWLAVG